MFELKSSLDALATLIAGSIALLVYFMQRGQNKKNAARAILSEIQNAEIALEEIQSTNTLGNTTSVLRTDYWSQYSHLLLAKFDFLEQRIITQFYNNCKLIQQRLEFIQQQESDQRMYAGIELQKRIVQLCLEEEEEQELTKKRDRMTQRFHSQTYWFDQNAARTSLIDAMSKIKTITNTPIGQKLKKCAGVK